jgi:hypothetical protein
MGIGSGMSRGDRNRNARLGRLRALVTSASSPSVSANRMTCPPALSAHRQLRRVLSSVWRNLDDEIGIQGGGDPVQERNGRNNAAGFQAG